MTQDPPTSVLRPRRVTVGFADDGRSTVQADSRDLPRLERPGGMTITEIWRTSSVPADLDDVSPMTALEVLGVPTAGLAVRVCTFPPAAQIDPADQEAYSRQLAGAYGSRQAAAQDVPGMHRTETVDVVTVISGELHVVTESGETVLRQGDSVVQRGTPHAWSNRGELPAVVLAIMMSAQPGKPDVDGPDPTPITER
jgi:mannose-6-phosphate isomerase-like protein (cupin superfamily)